MEDVTPEQQLLMWIRDELCDENAAELARRINTDSTYVNRLFYEIGKPGRKGLGPKIMKACSKAFSLPPGFWEGPVPPRTKMKGEGKPAKPQLEQRPLSSEALRMAAQFDALSEPEKQKIRGVWAALMQPASGDELGKSSGSPSGATQQKAA